MTLSKRPDTDPERFEIVEGEVVALMPTGDVHGIVEGLVFVALHAASRNGVGLPLVGEVGVVVKHKPRTVRGADAAFFLAHQLPYRKTSEGYLLTPPALVVEVLSPNDRASEVQKKVLEYLDAKVQVVWVVDADTRTVTVHLADRSSRTLRSHDALIAPGVLAALTAKVSALFEGIPPAGSTQPPLQP